MRSRLILREVYKWYQGITGPSVLLCFDYDASGRNNLGSGEQANIVLIRGPGAGFYLSLAKMIQFDLRKYINFSLGGGKANNPDETQKQQKLLVPTIVLGFHLFFVGHNDGKSISDSVSNGS